MLTRDLLRYRVINGRVEPLLLKATPAISSVAGDLLDHWRAGVGQRLGELEEAATPLLHRSRALVVARGLHKLIQDGCRFSDPPGAELLRQRAFRASAAALARPAEHVEQHRAALAQDLGLSTAALAEQLYADLPDQARLDQAPAWSVEELLGRYNLALCQGLLLQARSLRVMLPQADTGLRRKLLKALRWRRLLARIVDGKAGLTLEISGPASVIEQSTRYGMQLALFLPALCCARAWSASAELVERNGASATLHLGTELHLPGDSAFLGHVPDELRDLEATLAAACPGWRFVEPHLLPLDDGEIVAPDLQLESAGRTWRIELFHRWHGAALARRLAQVQRGAAPDLLIGVDRAIARMKQHAADLEHPAFLARGFLFSDLPSARALRSLVARVAETSTNTP